MRATLLGLGAVLILTAPALGADDPVAGRWKLQAKVQSFAFTLTCDFTRSGATLGGTCVDGGSGKTHPLTRGRVEGDAVTWSYQSSFLGKPFSANYAGRLTGSTLTGVVEASGRSGRFTATR
jgi:hypothetical protein